MLCFVFFGAPAEKSSNHTIFGVFIDVDTRGDQQIRGKAPPFLHPLINKIRIFIHYTAKHLGPVVQTISLGSTSSRWVCESICQTVANCSKTFAWYRKVLTCIANSSRTVCQSFKHVILFCATKIIAKPSPSHRICREPSPTLRRRLQTHRKELSAICTVRQICDINKTISRLNCKK